MMPQDPRELTGQRIIDTNQNWYGTILGRYQNREDAAAFNYDPRPEAGRMYPEASAAMLSDFSDTRRYFARFIVLDWLDNPLDMEEIDNAPNT